MKKNGLHYFEVHKLLNHSFHKKFKNKTFDPFQLCLNTHNTLTVRPNYFKNKTKQNIQQP